MNLYVAGVNLSGWVGVGLGGNCNCMCGVLMLLCWGGVVFAGLVSLIHTSYLQIHRHPTKFSLTNARKIIMTSQHPHAV